MNPGDKLLQCVQAQSGLLDEFVQALEAESAALLDNPTNLALAELTQRSQVKLISFRTDTQPLEEIAKRIRATAENGLRLNVNS